MRKIVLFAILLIFSLVAIAIYRDDPRAVDDILRVGRIEKGESFAGVNETEIPLKIPDNYTLRVLVSGLNKPRDILAGPNGEIFVSDIGNGKIYEIGEGVKRELLSGLNRPHGIEIDCVAQGTRGASRCSFFIAEEGEISLYEYSNHALINKRRIASLPVGGRHFTRSLLITEMGQEKRLLVSIGSSCDTCIEKDTKRAAVLSMKLDGSDSKTFSSGLRNAVFMAQRPKTDEVWVSEMGRDFLGDSQPPDEINILSDGGFYGWPYCYGARVQDKVFDSGDDAGRICSGSEGMHIGIPAHSAPLGLDFLDGDLLVAYHGSWNRSEPTGYKIVKIALDKNGQEISREDFISGWLASNGEILGRPVDVLVQNEDVFISDDQAGVVYKLTTAHATGF